MCAGSPWCLLADTQRVHPWMLGRPVRGADGRLANHLGSPFQHQPSLSFLADMQYAFGQKQLDS